MREAKYLGGLEPGDYSQEALLSQVPNTCQFWYFVSELTLYREAYTLGFKPNAFIALGELNKETLQRCSLFNTRFHRHAVSWLARMLDEHCLSVQVGRRFKPIIANLRCNLVNLTHRLANS